MVLFVDHDVAHGYSADALLRCTVRRVRLDEAFLFVWSHRDNDFVRRKRRERVSNGETDIRLACRGTDGRAGKLLGGTFGDVLRMTERLFVVCEPVERALTYDWHDNLDCFSVPDIRPQSIVCMFDGADDEDVPAHARNVPDRRTRHEQRRHHGPHCFDRLVAAASVVESTRCVVERAVAAEIESEAGWIAVGTGRALCPYQHG